MIKSVLFDLDGTLVDTAPDLGYALNLQLARHGKTTLPDETIRPFASHGTKGLLHIGFGLAPEDDAFNAMRNEYLSIYDTVVARNPTLFDGMDAVLEALEQANIPWGIVTNKPSRFTKPLVNSMGLDKRAVVVISGDEASEPKPSPQTLLMACEQTKIDPMDCLYIGDAERDVQAGNVIGMKTVVALFGYIDETDAPETWGADVLIETPLAILDLLD